MKIKYRGELIKLLDHFGLPKKAVELGCAEGRYSQEMYNWGLDELYLVDLWETIPFLEGCASFEQEWHDKNYKKVLELFDGKENVFIMKGFSHKMSELIPDETLGLIYLDAGHDYNSVKADIKYWMPKLVAGGICAGHDFKNFDYGVNRAVIEHTKNEGAVNIIEENGGIENIGFWFQK